VAKKKSSKAKPGQKKIKFYYMKGPDFRTIHCDGAIGGITPRGLVHLAVFSERLAIPKVTVQELTSEGRLGNELSNERETLDGIVRQMEVDLFFGEETAVKLREWLDERIKELQATRAKLPPDAKTH
jgi:hypothetical protein